MNVIMRLASEIKPYPGNPRANDPAVAAVAASIREFGFRQPIVVDDADVIIVGDTRYKAALLLGLDRVPVHVAAGLSPTQAKAYRLADNATNRLADWNYELLLRELGELKDLDFNLDALGFQAEELARLLEGDPTAGLTDPDDVPGQPDEAVTQRGDLYTLGEHRLLCGDSGKPEDVDRLLGDAAIHLVNTDPPYNVSVEPRSNNAIAAGLSSFQGATHHQSLDVARHPGKAKRTTAKLRAKDRPLANDFLSEEEFDRLLHAWFGNLARVLLPGRGFYIWGGYANCANYPPALKASGLYFSQAIIWDKQHPVLTRKDFMGAHEWCFYGWREGAAHQFFGPANATDLWSVKKVNPQSMIHLTEKPVELAVRALQYSSRTGENVLDLFGGGGSTLIAAEQTGRRAFLMELDPLYCDVIAERWRNFTGKAAQCERRTEPRRRRLSLKAAATASGICSREGDEAVNDLGTENDPLPGNDPLIASEPWERQPGEPNLWFARFESFRLMGPDRSLLGAVSAHRRTRDGGRAGRSVPQAWAHNAKRWRWRERAGAWDQLRRREARQAHAQAVEEMNARHVQEGRALQSKAIQGLKSLDVSLLSPAHLLRFCTEAAKLERLALGEPQPVDEVSPMNQTGAVDSFSVEDAVRADRELEEFEDANFSQRGDEAAADGSPQVP